MYESFFQFNDRPFAAVPEAHRYFPAACIEEARQSLSRAIERADGPGLVIGPAGTGKSLLCHVLARQFRGQFDVVMLASARLCTRRALLQNVLFELKLPYRDREEGELRLSLIDHLEPGPRCPHGMLLIIDEAHALPLRLLEEIRMITNLVRAGKTRVRLVLAGGSRLEERFAHPRLESFNQRLAARCYLQALSRQETAAYVRCQLEAVGGRADGILTDRAIESVYQATDGIPRIINQICDHALLLAFQDGSRTVDADRVEAAWADLQRLPTPWTTPAETPETDSVVEFGELIDEEAAPEANFEANFEAGAGLGLSADLSADAASSRAADPVSREAAPISLRLADLEDQDLVASQLIDPFGAAFEEEEIVIDRYAALDATLPAPGSRGLPEVPLFQPACGSPGAADGAPAQVASQDCTPQERLDRDTGSADCGRESFHAASGGEAHHPDAQRSGGPIPTGDSPSRTTQPVAGQSNDRPASERYDQHAVFETGAVAGDPRFHVVEFAQPVFLGPETQSDPLSGRDGNDGDEPTTIAIARDAVAGVEEDDSDLIIVTSERADDEHEVPAPPQARAERRDYRKLFAQLRRP